MDVPVSYLSTVCTHVHLYMYIHVYVSVNQVETLAIVYRRLELSWLSCLSSSVGKTSGEVMDLNTTRDRKWKVATLDVFL